jgi:hypothetical protein
LKEELLNDKLPCQKDYLYNAGIIHGKLSFIQNLTLDADYFGLNNENEEEQV